MRKLTMFMLVLGLLAVGCDSGSDGNGESDSERFIGLWTLVGVSDGNGDRSDVFAATYSSIHISFSGDNVAQLAVDAIDDAADVTYLGTYTVTESSNQVSVTLQTGAGPQTLSFTFDFESDTQLSLTSSTLATQLMSVLFQTSFAHPLEISLTKNP